MILFYMNGEKKQHSRIIRYLYRSCVGERKLMSTTRFQGNHILNNQASLIVFAGMIRGEGLIYKWCMENKKNFLYIDHAYLERGYNSSDLGNEWMRVVQNGFVWNKNIPETPERWNERFAKKYQIQPWRGTQGKNILVLPPSEATKYLFPNSVHWMNYTLDRLKKRFKAPIIIREKPDQVKIDPANNQVIGRTAISHNRSIESEIDDAKVIVTFNSAVPVQGTIQGIPCIASPYAAAHPMSIPEELWDTMPEPNRLLWLHQLVHHQFTAEEFKTGQFWNMIKKYDSISRFNKSGDAQ